ncbi:MAG: ROK family protein [Bacteroidota bacterium]
MPTPTVYAADLGGTTVTLGIVRGGQVVSRERLPADPAGGLTRALRQVRDRVDALADHVGITAPDAVGLALPCLLDRDRRRVVSTVDKYPDATDIDLDGWAQATWGVPAVLEGDAVAALLGEWQHGAAQGCRDVAMLTLGTGIGSAAVLDGRPFRGAYGAGAMLFGHLTVRLDGPTCLCGNVGCVETEASTWALRQRFGPEADIAWLFREADADVRGHALRAWGAAVVNVVHALDPERIVIGGGAARAGEALLTPIREYVAAHAWRGPELPLPSIVPGRLDDDAALVGLAWAATQSS